MVPYVQCCRRIAIGVIWIALSAGCSNEPRHGTGGGAAENSGNAAEQLLEQMIDAYAKCDSYGDQGELLMHIEAGAEPRIEREPFSLIFARPNKMRMHVYRGSYISDGKTTWGWVDDSGQILKRPAPSVLSFGEIESDPVLASALRQQFGGSPQLEMLLGTDVLDYLRNAGERPELLNDSEIDGVPHRRVRVKRGDGNFVYWIERDTLLLRRIEYPTGSLSRQQMGLPTASNIRVTAEFKNASFNAQILDEVFEFEAPPQAKFVDRLQADVTKDVPVEPAATLGKKLADFSMNTLDGRMISPQSTEGKTTLYVFWMLSSFQGLQALSEIEQACKGIRSRPDVNFVSVHVDGADGRTYKDAELTAHFTANQLDFSIARAEATKILPIFDVNVVPTLFIVGPDGTVQYTEAGLSPRLAQVGSLVARVAAGESLVAETRKAYLEKLQAFHESQTAGNDPSAPNSLPKTPLAAAGAPKHLKLATLWKSSELEQPGYVLGFDDPAGSRVLVADGLWKVAELDADGRVVRRVDLDLPKEPTEAVVSYWRTATDATGKRYFVGSAAAQQQLHLFDREFKKILSFPEGTHPGMEDVQMGDIDGDGTPEILVGYWKTIGVQAVGLNGIRQWSNRRLPENVQRLALTGKLADGKRAILVNTERGDLAILDHTGALLKEMPIGGRTARLVTTADLNGDGAMELAAITWTGPGTDVIVGVNGDGSVPWSYTPPAGVQRVSEMHNEMLVGGRVLEDGTGAWVIAAADGSIHLIGLDGKLIDTWGWGEAIRGINLATIGGKPALVVSDAKGVTALRLSK